MAGAMSEDDGFGTCQRRKKVTTDWDFHEFDELEELGMNWSDQKKFTRGQLALIAQGISSTSSSTRRSSGESLHGELTWHAKPTHK